MGVTAVLLTEISAEMLISYFFVTCEESQVICVKFLKLSVALGCRSASTAVS